MRCLGLPRISARTLHRSRSLEQLEASMHGYGSHRLRARGRLSIACALALLAAGAASGNSGEVAARDELRDASAVAANAELLDSSAVAARTGLGDASAVAAASAPFEDALPQAPSVAERLAIIRDRIQRALEYPPLARLLASDGEALVRFEIDAAGGARNVRVVRSSGHERLDASAVRAVEDASPLPWVYGSLEVPVHFELERAD